MPSRTYLAPTVSGSESSPDFLACHHSYNLGSIWLAYSSCHVVCRRISRDGVRRSFEDVCGLFHTLLTPRSRALRPPEMPLPVTTRIFRAGTAAISSPENWGASCSQRMLTSNRLASRSLSRVSITQLFVGLNSGRDAALSGFVRRVPAGCQHRSRVPYNDEERRNQTFPAGQTHT